MSISVLSIVQGLSSRNPFPYVCFAIVVPTFHRSNQCHYHTKPIASNNRTSLGKRLYQQILQHMESTSHSNHHQYHTNPSTSNNETRWDTNKVSRRRNWGRIHQIIIVPENGLVCTAKCRQQSRIDRLQDRKITTSLRAFPSDFVNRSVTLAIKTVPRGNSSCQT